MEVKAKENYQCITVEGKEICFMKDQIYKANIIQYTTEPYEILYDTGTTIRCDNDEFNQYFSLVVK